MGFIARIAERLRAAPRIRRAAVLLLPVAVGLVGAWAGLSLWGAQTKTLGPFGVELHAGFGSGVTDLSLPPFGTIRANTHLAPIHVRATWEDVHVRRLTDLVQESGIDGLAARLEEEAVDALLPFALRAVAAATAGGLLLALGVFRRNLRAVEIAVATALVSVTAAGAATAVTYRTSAFLAPSFSGSLTLAPQLIGPVRSAAERIDYFREQLGRVVDGAVEAYTSIRANPLGGTEVRVLHVSDIHNSPLGFEFAQDIARGFDVDLVVDTGDMTSFGTPAESLLARYLPGFARPYVFVRGNHDSPGLQAAVGRQQNAIVLDGTTAGIAGLEIYGLGHPVFLQQRGMPTDVEAFAEEARAAGERALADVSALPAPPDLVAVHDDRMAESLAGIVPVVISGHFHRESALVVDGTLYLRIGTTGAAGIETFTEEEGIPLSAEILYFAAPEQVGGPSTLVAFDVIRQSPESGSLSIERHLVEEEFAQLLPTPTPSPTA